MALKKQFKLLKTIPLERIADDLATDVINAIYSAVGNRQEDNLPQGDELKDVVDHALSRTGMSDVWTGLASTRIELKSAADGSGSMFGKWSGSPIVRAMTTHRLLRNASMIIHDRLPSDVFKSTFWMWALGAWSGEKVICLDSYSDHLQHSTIRSTRLNGQLSRDIDGFLSWLSKQSKWGLAGGGTYLAPLLEKWLVWEQTKGDPLAHRLDIVVSDGQIHDVEACNMVQQHRRFGHYRGILLNVGGSVGHVPEGFIGYHVDVFDLENTLRDELQTFVKEMTNFVQ